MSHGWSETVWPVPTQAGEMMDLHLSLVSPETHNAPSFVKRHAWPPYGNDGGQSEGLMGAQTPGASHPWSRM